MEKIKRFPWDLILYGVILIFDIVFRILNPELPWYEGLKLLAIQLPVIALIFWIKKKVTAKK